MINYLGVSLLEFFGTMAYTFLCVLITFWELLVTYPELCFIFIFYIKIVTMTSMKSFGFSGFDNLGFIDMFNRQL